MKYQPRPVTESRIHFLRTALQEAVRAGERDAAKRLTSKLAKLLCAIPNQTRVD